MSWQGDYRDQGFALVRCVLDRALLNLVASEIQFVFALQLKKHGVATVAWTGADSLTQTMGALLALNVGDYLAAIRHCAKLVSLQKLAASDSLLAVAEDIGMAAPALSTSPVLHVMSDLLRIPNGYFGVGPHQDFPSVQGSLDAMTMWLSLFDVPADGYPVQFIPGSHKRGLWPSQLTEHSVEVLQEAFKDEEFVSVPVTQGDLLVFNGFTVHRSAIDSNRSGLRIAASIRYDNTQEATYVDRLYPSAYRRTVIREPLFPGFPTNSQIQTALFQ